MAALWTTDGRIMHCGIISLRQSAATSEIVKRLLVTSLTDVSRHTKHVIFTNITTIDEARMLLELIFVRNGSLQVNLPCFKSDVQFLICYLSTM